ncbi:iron-containing alcohol dehydrogenase [Geopsychrobacter electrodiphilus]|uniref:iron-containing alcohol dehydrogenase n=1 Tax=Geopsychrobacter electrodiphilus TaxID=225196 RepID=UPI0003783846|nr:iron-containing alcohol dehydrogenase [Geopsychrobacter electrodiphilus]
MGKYSLNQHCKFEVPEIIFGRGLLNQVGSCAKRLGGKKVFLVSDEGLVRAGWVDRVMKSLQDAGLDFVLFDQITSNPKDYEIEAGFHEYMAHGADVIVGLGGGSAMDAAKGIAILGSNGGRIQDYRGVDQIHRPLPPLVLCPTTCGTGSDVSQFAVINDSYEKCKLTIMSRCVAPDISLTDPDTLATLSDEYLSSSAVDALSHAVEAYFSVASSSLTDVNATQALSLLAKSFSRAVRERRNDDLEDLSRASLHAGMAFSNALLGISHALAHPIGGLYDSNHGHVNAVLLPEVLRYDFPVVKQKLSGFAAALGHNPVGNEGFAEEMALETVDRLLDDGKAPRGLRNLGVREEDLPGLAARALDDVCLLTSPRQTDQEDLLGILKRSY